MKVFHYILLIKNKLTLFFVLHRRSMYWKAVLISDNLSRHPVFQALMFGMPIIASNYGGYLDFINKGKNVQLIDGVLQQANASPVFKANEKWFIPNFDDTVGAMKKAYTVNMRKTGENYVSDYSWKKTAEAIEKVIEPIRKCWK